MAPSSTPAYDRLSSRDNAREIGFAIARILLAGGFAFSGFAKLFDFAAATAEMAHHGLPSPAAMAAAVVVTQIGGSVLLIRPRTSGIGAAMLAGFTVMATLIAHAPWNDGGPVPVPQAVLLLQNAGILGGLVLAFVVGGEAGVLGKALAWFRSR